MRYSKNGGDLRKLGYGYDVFGNLTRQTLNGGQSQEDYQYDQLHRLVQSIRSGAASGTVSYGFDAVGNFTKKTDFSANTANAYVYTGGSCGGGANAVKQITLANTTTRTYCYDANGNLTSDNAGLSLKYDHQNLLTVAQRGALRDDFRYGADGMRTRSWGADGSRVYLPGYEHRLDTNETKVYVGDYAVITSGGGTPRKIDYLLKDRLGSVDAITNAAGTVTETRGYDAFGKPRSGTWADLNPAKMASTAVTPKGFTQHEHLNQLELIHMNGRVFDYNLGRFTGVDPFIQFPLNSQSLNPYSYILNNPLSGTDPSGYVIQEHGPMRPPSLEDREREWAEFIQRATGECRHQSCMGLQSNGGKGGDNGSDDGSGSKPKSKEQSKDIGSKIKDGISDLRSKIKSVGNALLESLAPEAARFNNMSDEERRSQEQSVPWMAAGFSNAGASMLNSGQSLLVDTLSQGQVNFKGNFSTIEVPTKHIESAASGEGLLNLLTMPIVEMRGAQGATTAWRMGKFDLDFRGSAGLKEALSTAFERAGLPKADFEVTKWGKNLYGKSFPVEWRHPSGAEVNIDRGHLKNGPSVPHVGYQTGGKRGSGGAVRGHILLDDVPYSR